MSLRARLGLGSLQRRLMLGAALFILAALVVAGLAIGLVLHRFARGQIDARLDAQIAALAADLVTGPGGLALAHTQEAPPFERQTDPAPGRPPVRARSDWYWQVSTPGRTLRSPSLGERDLVLPTPRDRPDARPRPADGIGPRGEALILRVLVLPAASDRPAATIAAAAPAAVLDAPLREAARTLTLTLGLLGLCLVVGVVAQVRIGLRPLVGLSRDLAAVRAGRLHRIPSLQPSEVRPLVTELNLLLEQNARGLEQARGHVANLAHGLKTPLATLGMALDAGRDPDGTLSRLVADMDARVRHHLRRARAAALGAGGRARADLSGQTADLARALERLHAERGVRIECRLRPGLSVACEAQDVDEMLGNLIDNACRWARHRVRVTLEPSPGYVAVAVEDDGPGLTDGQIADVVRRGRRLDANVPGDGFGLPITLELAELYGGSLALDRSDLGGLRARLRLPA